MPQPTYPEAIRRECEGRHVIVNADGSTTVYWDGVVLDFPRRYDLRKFVDLVQRAEQQAHEVALDDRHHEPAGKSRELEAFDWVIGGMIILALLV